MKLFVLCLVPFWVAAQSAKTPDIQLLMKQALAAREGSKTEESIQLYSRVLKLKPAEPEALWYQGLNFYDASRYPECEATFGKLVRVDGKNGQAWAFFGLCEFRNAKYEQALAHVVQGKRLDLGAGSELDRIAQWHYLLLLNKLGHFEAAISPLLELASFRPDTPMLTELCGLNALRLPLLPHEVPESLREPVLLAGRASLLAFQKKTDQARSAANTLLDLYPKQPNAHYLLAYILSLDGNESAIDEWKRELELDPKHVQALLQVANAYMQRGRAAEGLPYARQAVEIAPADFMTHTIYGRLLLEQEKLPEAIAELETAATSAPNIPLVHLHLGRAYALAGRTEQAAHEKQIYTELENGREAKLAPPGLAKKP
jgi:tetratricopeptide (TPR) repeat protein